MSIWDALSQSEEGNKRVSVLKSYGATTIPGTVIRMLPRKARIWLCSGTMSS